MKSPIAVVNGSFAVIADQQGNELYICNEDVYKRQDWYRGTADALYQNLSFLKSSHEPYVVIAAGDGIYKMDYNKVLEYHIEKKADITVVCKKMAEGEDVTRFGCVKINDDGRIVDFEEKPMVSDANTISCGIYVIRRRQLIELIERCAAEDRYDFVKDILVRYKLSLIHIYSFHKAAAL